MGDRLAHYAAYKSMYQLLEWLIRNNGDFMAKNHRRLTPMDIALPQTREWLYKKIIEFEIFKANEMAMMSQQASSITPQPLRLKDDKQIIRKNTIQQNKQLHQKVQDQGLQLQQQDK